MRDDGNVVLMDSYDPSNDPVFSVDQIKPPVRTVLVTGPSEPTGEGKHIMLDGLQHSQLIDFLGVYRMNSKRASASATRDITNWNATDAQLWVFDNIKIGMEEQLDGFVTHLLTAPRPTWKVLIVDFEDYANWQYSYLGTVVQRSHVRMAKRSIVVDRWITNSSGVHSGSLQPNSGTGGGNILHAPYTVRSDLVREIERQTRNATGLQRPVDVIHLWPPESSQNYATYRSWVSRVVQSLSGTRIGSDNRTLQAVTDLQGERAQSGRNHAQREYVGMLLRTKVVVVAQRDEWEDSYRLMEALVSGAAVVCDHMVAPPKGLIRGIHYLVYTNLKELRLDILSLLSNEERRLEIARNGYQLAMNRHRSWHRMEELIFGKVATFGNDHEGARSSLS